MQVIEISIHSNHPLVPQLPCKEQLLRFSLAQQSIQEVQLVLTGDIHTWIQIQDQQLFAYQQNICGPIFGGEFHAFKDYIITAGLRSQDVTMLSVLWEKEDLETFVKKTRRTSYPHQPKQLSPVLRDAAVQCKDTVGNDDNIF